jgi:hypothetical protein
MMAVVLDLSHQLLFPVYLEDDELLQRPKDRSECANIPRPCPFVSCQYNNYLDVDKQGKITRIRTDPHTHLPMLHEDVDPATSCAWDVAEQGEFTEEEIADMLDTTTGDIHGAVEGALRKLRHFGVVLELRRLHDLFNDK